VVLFGGPSGFSNLKSTQILVGLVVACDVRT
jgi:hypothetical protein